MWGSGAEVPTRRRMRLASRRGHRACGMEVRSGGDVSVGWVTWEKERPRRRGNASESRWGRMRAAAGHWHLGAGMACVLVTCTYSRIAACHAPGASVGAKAKPYPGMSTRRAPVVRRVFGCGIDEGGRTGAHLLPSRRPLVLGKGGEGVRVSHGLDPCQRRPLSVQAGRGVVVELRLGRCAQQRSS